MKNNFKRDKKKRLFFLRKEFAKKALKYIFLNFRVPLKIRWVIQFRLETLSRHSHSVRIQTRCMETYRKKSTISMFRVSRIFFRHFIRFGQIVNCIKKSW